jgi:hypothetical protein
MKAGHGKRYWKDCRRWSVYGAQWSRAHLAVHDRCRLKPGRRLPIQRSPDRKARRVEQRDEPCRSLFTFRVPCVNLLLDEVQSRLRTRPPHWPRRCRLSGRSTLAFAIASQPSKDKCGNTSTFSSGTKTSDIPADSRVPSQRERRFQSCPPSAVVEIPAMCNQREPVAALLSSLASMAGLEQIS